MIYGRGVYVALETHVSSASTAPNLAPSVWRLVEQFKRPPVPSQVPDVPKLPARRKRHGRKLTPGGDRRAYALKPMNVGEAWLFTDWQRELQRAGKSAPLGDQDPPPGWREKRPGGWRGELIAPSDVAQGEPAWLRDRLRELSAGDWGAWTTILQSRPDWLRGWLAGLVDDPRTRGDYPDLTQDVRAGLLARLDPAEWARLVLLQAAPGVVGPTDAAPPLEAQPEGPGDYDPVRDGPYSAWLARQPPEPAPVPAPPGAVALAPVLRHEDPIRLQTRRLVPERDRRGRLTGRRTEVVVPTMRIDLASDLGRRIRIIDDDKPNGAPPRGALAVIFTSRGRRQWVVPVDARGRYPGMRRDDPKRAALREAQGAESIQLADHRTGERREAAILVGPRSRNFDAAVEFLSAWESLR